MARIDQAREGPSRRGDRKRAAEHRKRANTFAAVAEDFITNKIGMSAGARKSSGTSGGSSSRHGAGVRSPRSPHLEMRTHQGESETAPSAARNLLALLKRMFTWAVDQGTYDIPSSPAQGLKPKRSSARSRSATASLAMTNYSPCGVPLGASVTRTARSIEC